MLSLRRRYERAIDWPIHLVHYARGLWAIRNNIDPPLSLLELFPLAKKHVHQFVWGQIRYIELYLPKRKKE